MKRAWLLLAALAACGGERASRPLQTAPPPRVVVVTPPAPLPPPDPLGPRPEVALPAPYTPPVPVVYTRPNGMTVWLVERHSLPIVAVDVVVSVGASSDPKDRGGLAAATANMLDEGAGSRGPLELARAVDLLGAALSTHAYADYSTAEIHVLRRNLDQAMAILGDVVVRPRFFPAEWKRVHDLWMNELRARASDPEAVSSVVSLGALFGASHPYGHPNDGTLASAPRVKLEDVKGFYASAWRPSRASVVVAGDVSRAELDPFLDSAFGAWTVSAPELAPVTYPPVTVAPRVVIVDRPDAPQSVIALALPGVAASEPDAAPLGRANAALGGSFTSRLNQDLREEHGWSYGARSRLSFTRGAGMFTASAAVFTDKTGVALQAMLADVGEYARTGPTDEEAHKTLLLARSDLVETFESVDGTAARFARNAGIGLPADHEAKAALRRAGATKEDLRALASRYFDPKRGVILIVGPRAKIVPQIAELGFTSVETRRPDGDGSLHTP